MKLSFIGATSTVTGSMILCETKNSKFLVDAGLYQGEDTPKIDSHEKEFNPKEIDFILLTHAHLDHCGYIPRLFKLGFKGQVICTFQTQAVAKVIMSDNARIELERVKRFNKNIRKQKLKIEPFYSLDDVARSLANFQTVEFNEPITLGDISYQFIRSGHILGASSILVSSQNKSYLFSGDIGTENDPIHVACEKADLKVDTLILESTYGNRVHSHKDISLQLTEILTKAIKEKKRIIIPAFSFGRSQIILNLISDLFSESPELKIPLYLDSPMSAEILGIYKENTKELCIDKIKIKEMESKLRILEFPKERESILQKENPYIVLTSSGMMSGGPVLYYLEKCATVEDSIFIVTGYQARGTHGYDFTHEQLEFLVKDKSLEFRSEIIRLEGLSSHADQGELIQFATGHNPQKVYLVHGEDDSKAELQAKLIEAGFETEIP